jgi:hypothetical protein
LAPNLIKDSLHSRDITLRFSNLHWILKATRPKLKTERKQFLYELLLLLLELTRSHPSQLFHI